MFGLSLVWDFAHVEWAKRQGDKHICKKNTCLSGGAGGTQTE